MPVALTLHMARHIGRRSVLKGLGAVGVLGMMPQVTASPAENRFIVDVGDGLSASDQRALGYFDLDLIHELEHVGYIIVEGTESDVETFGYDFTPDIKLEVDPAAELPDWVTEDIGVDDVDSIGAADESDLEAAHIPGHPGDVEAYNWDVDALDLETAHQTTTGVKPNGDPVRIGIIDDGIYPDHPGLNVVGGVDLTGDGASPFHPSIDHYHGTHVSGIAAGGEPAGDADGTFTGVAPDAELVSLRYFSFAEGGFFGDFATAVNEAINFDCDVINSSLGFINDQPISRTYYDFYIQDFIDEVALAAEEHGIVWCGSAGNSGNDADDLVPGSAKSEHVFSVSATGPTGIVRPDQQGNPIFNDPIQSPEVPSYFTTHGNEYVDVSAPGGDWSVYFPLPDQDENPAAYIAAIRNYIAPDGVLSSFPPDVVGSSLLVNYPLPAYALPYGLDNLHWQESPGLTYELYARLEEVEGEIVPVEFFVNPDDTAGLTFLASYDEPHHATGWIQGTSMSAPEVTGVAALLSAANPDWSPREIKRVMRATARDVGKTTYHGHGFVDPVAALSVDDPEEVRDDLGNPDDRDDGGRNEARGGNPRNSSGQRGNGRGGDDDDGGSGDGGR